MESVGHSTQFSSSAMQRKAIIAKLKASGLTKGKPEDENSGSEEQEYNFEKLKTFHIPRKKEQLEGKDLLTILPLESREYTHTLYPAIKSSFFYPQSSRRMHIHKVELVNNHDLLKEFLDKKKDMKDEGRTEKELSECFVFLHSPTTNDVSKICEHGLCIGNSTLVSLGKPNLGVYVSKHADVVSATPLTSTDSGCLIVFKLIKGKTKLVTESKGSTTNQEPIPLYDCHLTKWNSEGSRANHTRAFQALQYYVYEYGELDIVNRPRQILPYAVLHFNYVENERIGQQRDNSQTPLDSSAIDIDQTSKYSAPNPGIGVRMFCLWKGKLLVKGGLFCNVEIRSENDAALNKAFLDNNINVKMLLSVTNFLKQLPATLLNKSGKKHNVVFRNRNFNIFTLVPADETGFGKFRQLIAHLVQQEAIAFVPLRMGSCVYLIQNGNLSVNKMGLSPLCGSNDKPNNQFLHILVVTPKHLTMKINDQKIYNLITVRKRRDPQGENKVPEELDQKLRSMNIESSSAAGSLAPEQHEKLLLALRDKKRLQISEKLLHNHYKESITYFSSKGSYLKFIEFVKSIWCATNQVRLDYFKPKENKTSASQSYKSILKSASSQDPKNLLSKRGKLSYLDIPVEGDAEATFSDEDDDGSLSRNKSFVSRSKSSLDPRPGPSKPIKAPEKRRASLEIDSTSSPPVKISRPSFKALVEIILSASVEELMLHPDFVFSERFDQTHRVTKEVGFSEAFDIERERQISVEIRQQVPFLTINDCPYAHEDNPVVKSMLRALNGNWNDENVSPADQEKVNWVRNVLHKNKTDSESKTVASQRNNRTVSDDSAAAKELSPYFPPGSSSADSGFASSSTTTTPNAASQQIQPADSSLQDIADMLATALQGRVPAEATSALLDGSNVQATTQSIIQTLVKAVNESGEQIPSELKSIVEELTAPVDKGAQLEAYSPKDSSPEPGALSTSSSNASPTADLVVFDSPVDFLRRDDVISGHPQDSQSSKALASPPRLSLPSYRFPPSQKAAEQLPKDEEASRRFNLTTRHFHRSKAPGPKTSGPMAPLKAGTTLSGPENLTSSYHGAIDLASIPGIAIKKKRRTSLTSRAADPSQSSAGLRGILTTFRGTATTARGTFTTDGQTSGSTSNRTTRVDHYQTITKTTATESYATNPGAPCPPSTGGRAPFAHGKNLLAGKNIGNISIRELTDILRLIGKAPGIKLAAPRLPDTKQVPPRPAGILRGVQGRTHGRTESTGIEGSKSTGQMVRVIDDKRTLHDVDTGSGPLVFDKPSAILSNRLIVASAARSNASQTSGLNFLNDNFTVVNPFPKDGQRSINSLPPQSTADGITASSTMSSASTPTTAFDVAVADRASSNQTTVNVDTSLNLPSALPENYIKQIHRKFKQQQQLRKKQDLTSDPNRPEIAATDFDTKQSTPQEAATSTTVDDNKPDDCAATTTAAHRSPPQSVAAEVTSVVWTLPSASVVSSALTDSANVPPAAEKATAPPEKDILSEISQVLQNVKSARHGQQSADTLSTKLLELAMQLRETSGGADAASESKVAATSDSRQSASVDATLTKASQKHSREASPREASAGFDATATCADSSEVLSPAVSKSETHHCKPTTTTKSETRVVDMDIEILKSLASTGSETSENNSSRLATEANENLTPVSSPLEANEMDAEKLETVSQDAHSSSLASETIKSSVAKQETDDQPVRLKTPVPSPIPVAFEPGLPIPTIGTGIEPSGPVSSDNQAEALYNDPSANASIESHSHPIQVVVPQVRRNDPGLKPDVDFTRDTYTPTMDDTYTPTMVNTYTPTMDNTYTPTMDNTYIPHLSVKIRESYSRAYRSLNPLSRAALSKVVIDDEIKSILQRFSGSSPCDEPAESERKKVCEANVEKPVDAEKPSSIAVQTSPPSQDEVAPQDPEVRAEKSQLIAHVKPQPSTAGVRACQSFYVFNPRNHLQCDRISGVLMQSGRTFQMHDIADAIADSTPDAGGMLAQVTHDMLDRALGDHTLWIVIRSADIELMPALPHLSLLKCAGPRVNFIQVDSAEEVHARKYSNIMAGEFGVIMPVSSKILLENKTTVIGLLSWMIDLNKKKGNPYWRLALPKHILRQLKTYRDGRDVDDSVRTAAVSLLGIIERHDRVIVDVTVTDEPSDDVSTTEVFDAAISLQMHYVEWTRHVVVLTDDKQLGNVWNTHRRAGIAVTTVGDFVKTIIEEKMRGADEERVYSPLLKIYKVEK